MQDDVARVRRNWAAAIAAHDIVGELFYDALFRAAPETRTLFPKELDEQGRKLVQTLSWIVDNLDDPDALLPAAEALALRHVGYGVKAEQYQAVGEALMATLRAGLGASFSNEDAAAWARVYGGLSETMIAAAYPEQA